MDFKPGNTAAGKLAPFQVAKAVAYEQVINSMERHMGKTCWELLGQSKAQFTVEQLTVVGGGSPSDRAVKKHWAKTKNDPKNIVLISQNLTDRFQNFFLLSFKI